MYVEEAILYLDKPLWKATEYMGSKSTITKAIGIFSAVIALPFAVFGRLLQWGSHLYFRREYLSFQSQAPERQGTPKKFITFNVCMFQGILPTLFGGMTPASERMDRVADFLKTQDADVVCLQEVAFDPATQLTQKLKDHYRYFYYRIGTNPFGMESALFWASKFPLRSDPVFVPFNVPGMQPGMQGGFRRGFFIAEFGDRLIITTHLDPHSGKGKVRLAQLQAILDHIKTPDKPVVLLGDLNIEPDDTAVMDLLEKHFSNFNRQAVENPNEETGTCFDNIEKVAKDSKTPPKFTVVDHILTSTNIPQIKIPAFDPSNISHALSDHHAVVLLLS